MDQEFADLIQSFVEDTTDHLNKVEEVLLRLDSDASGSEASSSPLHDAKRPLHTIKGNAGMLGFMGFSKAVHAIEEVVKETIGEERITAARLDLFFGAMVQLKTALRDIGEKVEEPERLAEGMEEFLAQAGASAATRDDVEEDPTVKDLKNDKEISGLQTVTSDVLRIKSERIDQLLLEMGDMSIYLNSMQAWLSQISGLLDREQRFTGNAYFDRLNGAFLRTQERAVELRMVPLDTLFRQIPMWVRDLSKGMGKAVSAKTSGGELLIDKNIVERLQEPFIHLIRNSIDHGIESLDERKEWGKPDRGMIRVEASPQASILEIRITDDGRGLNRLKLLEKAREAGLLQENEEPAVWEELIFRQGLSTAAKVSQISGRGVGMDIVRDVIQELDGTITVSSEQGLGATFIISVPLTLAVTSVLEVSSENEVFGVPVRDIIETDSFDPKARSRASGCELYKISRDEVVPLLDLRKLTDRSRKIWPKRSGGYIVKIARGEKSAVLATDALIGELNVVLKPLRDEVFDHPLLRSASIQGDGSVTFVVDTSSVLDEGSMRLIG